jgi:hypothetical protein
MELSRCDADQLERMFLKFFDDRAAAARFAAEVEPGRWAPATVQERLLKAPDPEAAIAAFRTPELLRAAA